MAQRELPRPNPNGRRKLKPVAKGSISKPKKSGADILENQIAGHIKAAVEYAVKDEIVPRGKEAIRGAIGNFVDSLLYGHGKAPARSSSGRTNYSGMYSNRQQSTQTETARTKATYKTLSYPSEREAEDVLEELRMLIDDEGRATIGDLFDASEVSSEYTDYDWGWTDLNEARVRGPIDGKWSILFPSSPKRIR